MSLSREVLLERMKAGTVWKERLIVEPFFPDSIDYSSAAASLDFHLGNRFTYLRSRRAAQHDPLSSEPGRDVIPSERFIPMGQDFSSEPGHIVLGTTLEWFRFPSDMMAYVIGRSIWGRRGLLIVTAQAVHPGSSGTITLEMSNLGEVALTLRPGTSIGQLFFHRIEKVDGAAADDLTRHSPFSGAVRPILGKYKQTKVEQLLLGLR
jgi:dCTP deaminase